MKKYLAALLVAVGLMLVMAVPAFAQECGGASCELHPGKSEGSRSIYQTPPLDKPGASNRHVEANEHDTNTDTGRGKRIA